MEGGQTKGAGFPSNMWIVSFRDPCTIFGLNGIYGKTGVLAKSKSAQEQSEAEKGSLGVHLHNVGLALRYGQWDFFPL